MARIHIIWLLLLSSWFGTARAIPPATITGIVTDESHKPLADARIDHTGRAVVIAAAHLAIGPSPGEIRTDSKGRFRAVTAATAIVVRKPGYESQRVRVMGDAEVEVTLHRIGTSPRCKLAAAPAFKTKEANDVDYVATWYYIETKEGPRGIISGSGPLYSFGAPSDSQVWTSVEYTEVMYENGIVDAAGQTADGKYWRSRTVLGAAAQYYNEDRETAERLDCVMDHVPVKLP